MNELFSIFEDIGLPYIRQGSLADDEKYPESFFSYWHLNAPSLAFRDNTEKAYSNIVNVCSYTCDAERIYSLLENDFLPRAKAAGWIVIARPADTPADEPNYYGRVVRIQKIIKT